MVLSSSCLNKRVFKHMQIDATKLDVHLQRRDPFAGSGNFEVHISVMVFKSHNVRENCVLVSVMDQPHRDTCNKRCHFHFCRAKCQRTAANSCHRRRTVTFKYFRYQSDRPVIIERNSRLKRPLCQISMPKFTSSRSADIRSFSYRITREVVMYHEIL